MSNKILWFHREKLTLTISNAIQFSRYRKKNKKNWIEINTNSGVVVTVVILWTCNELGTSIIVSLIAFVYIKITKKMLFLYLRLLLFRSFLRHSIFAVFLSSFDFIHSNPVFLSAQFPQLSTAACRSVCRSVMSVTFSILVFIYALKKKKRFHKYIQITTERFVFIITCFVACYTGEVSNCVIEKLFEA